MRGGGEELGSNLLRVAESRLGGSGVSNSLGGVGARSLTAAMRLPVAQD